MYLSTTQRRQLRFGKLFDTISSKPEQNKSLRKKRAQLQRRIENSRRDQPSHRQSHKLA